MSGTKRFGGALVLLLLLGRASVRSAQGLPPQEEVRLGTIGVHVPVAVYDKSGRLVTDLTVEDFEVREDGVPQRILSFSKENELPLSVALVMDASNSVRPKLKFEKEAVIAFLDGIIRPRKDRALLVTFGSVIELHQDFTDDVEDLKAAVHAVKAGGATPLYDALYRVIEEKMTTAPGRRVLILVSDGEDTASERTLEEVVELAQRLEVIIYSVGTLHAGGFGVTMGLSDAPGMKELRRLAEETGGRAFFPEKILDLERNFSDISAELRSQYYLFYVSSNQNRDGRFRKIEVRIPTRKDLRVRTRRGYKAPYAS
jgi:Ca-activated chloride channel family protein